MKAVNCINCESRMSITELSCSHCEITIRGEFRPDRFSCISEDTLEFIEIFVLCRGNIKEVEKMLGISYPTVKAKIDKMVSEVRQIKEIENEIFSIRQREAQLQREKEEKMKKLMSRI